VVDVGESTYSQRNAQIAPVVAEMMREIPGKVLFGPVVFKRPLRFQRDRRATTLNPGLRICEPRRVKRRPGIQSRFWITSHTCLAVTAPEQKYVGMVLALTVPGAGSEALLDGQLGASAVPS
jgi:hypothetical protein